MRSVACSKSVMVQYQHCNILSFRTVTSMEAALPHLSNIQELLKNAIFLQQQLKYEQSRKQSRSSASLYQRFSAHLNSVDLAEAGEVRSEPVISEAAPCP